VTQILFIQEIKDIDSQNSNSNSDSEFNDKNRIV